jgi:hypothetical protein
MIVLAFFLVVASMMVAAQHGSWKPSALSVFDGAMNLKQCTDMQWMQKEK